MTFWNPEVVRSPLVLEFNKSVSSFLSEKSGEADSAKTVSTNSDAGHNFIPCTIK